MARGTRVISVSGIALLQLSKDLFKSQQIYETKCNVYNNEGCKADWPHLNTRAQASKMVKQHQEMITLEASVKLS